MSSPMRLPALTLSALLALSVTTAALPAGAADAVTSARSFDIAGSVPIPPNSCSPDLVQGDQVSLAGSINVVTVVSIPPGPPAAPAAITMRIQTNLIGVSGVGSVSGVTYLATGAVNSLVIHSAGAVVPATPFAGDFDLTAASLCRPSPVRVWGTLLFLSDGTLAAESTFQLGPAD